LLDSLLQEIEVVVAVLQGTLLDAPECRQ